MGHPPGQSAARNPRPAITRTTTTAITRRRHLTVSQAAMCAQRARKMYDEAAKERQKLSEGRGKKGLANCPDLKGTARDQVGETFGVSGQMIDHQRHLLARG